MGTAMRVPTSVEPPPHVLSGGSSSPALPHQALEQPLQLRALPQAAELTRERPVGVPRGPGKGWVRVRPARGRWTRGVGVGTGSRAHLGAAGRAAEPGRRSNGNSRKGPAAMVGAAGAGRVLSATATGPPPPHL